MSEAISEEDVELFRDLVFSVNTQYYLDSAISGIIMEEAPAFLNDQKSAEDVAAIIQNRVQTFVDEGAT